MINGCFQPKPFLIIWWYDVPEKNKTLEREVSPNIVKDGAVTVIWAKKYGNSASENTEN